METEDLGTRIKGYEKSSEFKVNYDQFLIIRIDGHKFSKFTKHFNKPYDEILSKAMENATRDLVENFGAVTGYTQSDEITLVFPPQFTEKENGEILNNQVFAGRTQKIASLVASYTSIRFNFWLQDGFNSTVFTDDKYKKVVQEHIGMAWFDARVFGVPTDTEAFNVFMWRIRDAEKNSRSMFAQAFCSHKELLNKTGVEQVEFCLQKTGKDWNGVDDRYKYGILVKKESYEKIGMDGEPVLRTRLVSWSERMTKFDNNSVKTIVEKLK